MSAPKYNVIAAAGWDDDGPTSLATNMGGTDDPAEVLPLIVSAVQHLSFAGPVEALGNDGKTRTVLPLSAWVADETGRPITGHALAMLMHWPALVALRDAHAQQAARNGPASVSWRRASEFIAS